MSVLEKIAVSAPGMLSIAAAAAIGAACRRCVIVHALWPQPGLLHNLHLWVAPLLQEIEKEMARTQKNKVRGMRCQAAVSCGHCCSSCRSTCCCLLTGPPPAPVF